MRSIAGHVQAWQEQLQICERHMETLIGDALLSAGCLCYLGLLKQEKRDQLLQQWIVTCIGDENDGENDENDIVNDCRDLKPKVTTCPMVINDLPCRRNFVLKDLLTSQEELYKWRCSGLSVSSRAVQNALIMRMTCENSKRHWPLLIDTDLQSYAWLKMFHNDKVKNGKMSRFVPFSSHFDLSKNFYSKNVAHAC